jgi:hypothetical protein
MPITKELRYIIICQKLLKAIKDLSGNKNKFKLAIKKSLKQLILQFEGIL